MTPAHHYGHRFPLRPIIKRTPTVQVGGGGGGGGNQGRELIYIGPGTAVMTAAIHQALIAKQRPPR